MTFLDVKRLFHHWNRNPPLRSLVSAIASALGVKITAEIDTSAHLTAEEAMRLMAATGGRIEGIGRIGGG